MSSLSGIGKGNGLARTEQCLNTIYGKVDCHIKKYYINIDIFW